MRGAPLALATYEALAPFYDAFSADYDHDTWVARLLELAGRHGLRGRRALDVACGTGKSARPLLERGFAVAACDVSPAMVRIARRRLGAGADVFVADMRRLGPAPRVDLVTCLDDAVNYLLRERDLRAAFACARRRLRPGGVYVFDTNTLATYRSAFAHAGEHGAAGHRFRWRGLGEDRAVWRASVEVMRGGARVASATHVQRHWPVATVLALLRESGFASAVAVGQTTGAVLHGEADELQHTKAVFVAVAPARGGREGGAR
jgi:SAM-dependent methyltransferase